MGLDGRIARLEDALEPEDTFDGFTVLDVIEQGVGPDSPPGLVRMAGCFALPAIEWDILGPDRLRHDIEFGRRLNASRLKSGLTPYLTDERIAELEAKIPEAEAKSRRRREAFGLPLEGFEPEWLIDIARDAFGFTGEELEFVEDKLVPHARRTVERLADPDAL